MPARFPATAPCARASARLTSPFLRRRSPLAAALSLAVAVAWPASSAIAQTTDDASAKAKQLDTVNVTGTRIDDVEGGRVGTKMDVPLRETPQSVSVVTRDQMDRRGAQTVEEALRYSAGLSAPYGYEQRYDWIDVRGFQTVYDLYRDGLAFRGGTFSGPRLDPFVLERVEVLKGPAGVMYGAGSPGGLINLVSKRPRADGDSEIVATVGTDNQRELGVDVGGALGSGWLYRIVGNGSDRDTQVDYNTARRWLLMPSLRWSNDDTSIDLQATWQKLDSVQGSTPRFAPYARDVLASFGVDYQIPENRFLGEPGYDRFDSDYRSFGYTFEHAFNETWSIRQNAIVSRMDLDYRSIYLAGLNFANPFELTRYAFVRDERSDLAAVDTSVQGKFGSDAVAHTLLVGVDYKRFDNDEGGSFGCALPLNALNPVYGRPFDDPAAPLDPAAPCLPQPLFYSSITSDQVGVYAQDHIKFADKWVLLLSGRYDIAKNDVSGGGVGSASRDEAFSGRAGLVYVGQSGFAPYLSYSESFQPLNTYDFANNRAFEPETGRQYEIGARWQPIGSDVLISTAVFDIRKKNMLYSDPNNIGVQLQAGEVRSRGFEAEANTEIAAGLRVGGAYTYLDTEVLEGDGVTLVAGKRLPLVPKQSVSGTVDYTFSGGVLDRLQAGIGVRYTGPTEYQGRVTIPPGGPVISVETPGYTLVDANVHYPWKSWEFSVTASNLFDRDYDVGCSDLTCYFGYQRRVSLSARYRW